MGKELGLPVVWVALFLGHVDQSEIVQGKMLARASQKETFSFIFVRYFILGQWNVNM